jgi:hypothetical protein
MTALAPRVQGTASSLGKRLLVTDRERLRAGLAEEVSR